MACYAAVVSLKQTLDQLRNNNNVPTSFPSPEIIEFAYEEVRSMQKLLQELDLSSGLVQESGRSDEFDSYGWLGNSLDASLKRGKESRGGSRGFRDGGLQRMGSLDRKMREAACELEDVLETHFVNLICDNHPPTVTISMDLQELKRDVDSFSRTVKELKEEYTKEGEDEEEDEEVSISRIEFRGVKSNKMVGFSDVIRRMKDRFLEDILLVNIGSLVGMAGLGKTTLAKEFFEDPSVLNWFHHRAWVTVGPKYHLTDIVQSILIQVTGKELLVKKGDELASRLRRRLRHRRCLVVLDDVWNNEIITHVEDLIMGATFGDERGSLILLTTRLDKVGSSNRRITIDTLKLRFMNKEESWNLLSRKVFDEMPCPPHLEKAGKKIADNCEGLPLTVVTVADILSKSDEMTPGYWNKVAEQENSVFADAYDRMSAVLLRSYNYLPRYLKEYFLYLGVFPQKYDIPLSKLAMLWSVEGCFLLRASKYIGNLRGYLSKHLEELIGKNLVLVRKRSYKHKPKIYGLHSALWHSCVREAERNKFFHVLNKYADCLAAESMRNQRRLCIHNNVLFGIKDVHKSMSSISNARSFLCTGPHHRYPVPVCFDRFRLLRVIDALTIHFYEFPMEQVLKLVQLRYLALTCDRNLPASISKLMNLQIVIVRRHLSIINVLHESDESSYLPKEIWDMKELEHLQVTGGKLPDPCDGAILPNLATLLDASAHTCTKGVLKGLPKLKKLGIRVELSVGDDAVQPLSCFDHISNLNKLESLKCVVVNPVLRSGGFSPLASRSSIFPKSLKKLSLSGLGCPWEDVQAIASLPKLEVLKLRCYAFRGPKWETREKGFPSLEFLLIEDTDLMHWTMGDESFLKIQCVSLKQCYKLQELQWKSRKSLEMIEMVDCNPLAMTCARAMQKNRSKLEVNVHSSWDHDEKLKA